MDRGEIQIYSEGRKYYCYFKDASCLPAAAHAAVQEDSWNSTVCALVNSGGEFLECSSGDVWRVVRIDMDKKTVAILDNNKCMLYVPLKEFKNTTHVFCILEGKNETTDTLNDKNK